MRGNSHVQFLGEGRSVMAVSYPTASLTRCMKKPRLVRGFFLGVCFAIVVQLFAGKPDRCGIWR